MSLAPRELTRALEIKKQLDKQAAYFESLSQANVIALQQTARAMAFSALNGLQARAMAFSALSGLQARAMAFSALNDLHTNSIFTSQISSYMIPPIQYNNIDFNEIHNKLINDLQRFSNNWVIPNTFINISKLQIDIYKPINLLEPTVDVKGSNHLKENLADNISQEFTVDEKHLLDQINLSLEIDRLCSELYQDRRMILKVILSTLGSYSVLLGLVEGSDRVLLPVLIILGNCLLDRWNKTPPTIE